MYYTIENCKKDLINNCLVAKNKLYFASKTKPNHISFNTFLEEPLCRLDDHLSDDSGNCKNCLIWEKNINILNFPCVRSDSIIMKMHKAISRRKYRIANVYVTELLKLAISIKTGDKC